MRYYIYLLILFSIILPSNLREWIDVNSNLINDESYVLQFQYSMTKSKHNIDSSSIKDVEYYSINSDSSLTRLSNRITLSYKDYSEVIDLSSKQKIIQTPNSNFIDSKSKLSSIFTDKNFKLIKISKSKYLLSLNDYYINMNITYNKDQTDVSELLFYQAPYWIYIQNLTINSFDSIPYNYSDWDDYEVFDFR